MDLLRVEPRGILRGLEDAAGPPLGTRARCFDDLGSLVRAVVAEARPGDHVLVMSNGAFGGVHDQLLAGLAEPASQERAA